VEETYRKKTCEAYYKSSSQLEFLLEMIKTVWLGADWVSRFVDLVKQPSGLVNSKFTNVHIALTSAFRTTLTTTQAP
jgi:hypothetical protein